MREFDFSEDNLLAAGSTEHECEREPEHDQERDKAAEKKGGDDNRGDTRLLATGSERGQFVAAVMLIIWSTLRSRGGTADAGVNQNNPEMTARTTPGVIGSRICLVHADFDNAGPDNQLDLYARAPLFHTLASDTGSFCKRVATERYLACGDPLRALG